MIRAWLTRLGIFSAGGLVLFLFLLVAQVNLDDLRLKLGEMRPMPRPDIVIGGFYTIRDSGRLVGPHCLVSQTVMEKALNRQVHAAQLTNSLGSSLPILARWSSNLMGASEIESFLGDLKDTESDDTYEWSGHTLYVPEVVLDKLPSTGFVPQLYTEMVREDPNCEPRVNQIARQGDCIAIVFAVASANAHGIGYALHDDRRCFLPMSNVGEKPYDPILIPAPPSRFTAMLSRLKDRIGLLENRI